MSRIAILGAGAWGSALALSLARRGGHDLSLWAHDPAHAAQLAATRDNTRYLPGFALPPEVRVTAHLFAVRDADVILCAMPSQSLRSVMEEIAPALTPQQVLLSAAKGVEEMTSLRMSEVMASFCPHQ